MTRSTARRSCSLSCSRENSGRGGSPRRSWASRRCALSMAFSPPLAATYMSTILADDADGARQRGDLALGQEDQGDAAGEKRMSGHELRRDISRQPRSEEPLAPTDTRPLEQELRS